MTDSTTNEYSLLWEQLYKLGKKSIAPGGEELSEKMVELLNITTQDKVVEFAPGIGKTAGMVLKYKPLEYTAIDNNQWVAEHWGKLKEMYSKAFRKGPYWETGKNPESISKTYGENYLIALTEPQQNQLLAEASRISKVGALFGMHEIMIADNEASLRKRNLIEKELSMTLQRPIKLRSKSEWLEMLKKHHFALHAEAQSALQNSKTRTLLKDEDWLRSVKICYKWVADKSNRAHLRNLINIFKKYQQYLQASVLVALKE